MSLLPLSGPLQHPAKTGANALPDRIPFYAYIRLGFLLYLVLPQSQGARYLYEAHLHPYLERNEPQIENLIATAHDRLRSAGASYLRAAFAYFKARVLGLPVEEQQTAPEPEPPRGAAGYTQSLLARFSMPSARVGAGAGADFYNFLSSAVASAVSGTAGAGSAAAAAPSAGESIIPGDLRGADRASFIAAQRARLAAVLNTLDSEARSLEREETLRAESGGGGNGNGEEAERPPSGLSSWSGLSKSRSEVEFEKIDAESGGEEEGEGVRRRRGPGGGGWMPFAWGFGPGGNAESSGVEK